MMIFSSSRWMVLLLTISIVINASGIVPPSSLFDKRQQDSLDFDCFGINALQLPVLEFAHQNILQTEKSAELARTTAEQDVSTPDQALQRTTGPVIKRIMRLWILSFTGLLSGRRAPEIPLTKDETDHMLGIFNAELLSPYTHPMQKLGILNSLEDHLNLVDIPLIQSLFALWHKSWAGYESLVLVGLRARSLLLMLGQMPHRQETIMRALQIHQDAYATKTAESDVDWLKELKKLEREIQMSSGHPLLADA